jgi:hypothetical protein
MTNEDIRLASDQELIEYFTKPKWGKIYEDDKYFANDILEDRFLVYVTYAFSHLGLPRPTRAQYEIARYVADQSNPHRLVWAMRGISKSLQSQLYDSWRFLRNPDEHILVVSAGSGRAVNFTQFVKKLMTVLPILRPLKPRNNIDRTSSQAFDIAGSMASDSPSMYAVGVGNQITGMRSTLLNMDDVETHLTVQSLALTERVEHSVNEAHNLLMSGYDESITLATPHSQNSIYLNWIDRGTHAFIVPARYPEDTSIYMGFLAPFISEALKKDPSLVGQAVDERLDDDFLRQKELKIGKSNFKLQYMCDVSESDTLRHPLKLSDLIVTDVSDEDAPIKIGYSSMPDNLLFGIKHNGFKADKFYTPLYMSEERMEYTHKIMSIDPSGRGKDEVGISILYMLNTRIFIKKIVGLQGGYEEENLSNIANLCALHGVQTVVVESNFGDGIFAKVLEPYLKRISPTTAIDEVTAKGQKEVRIIDVLEPMLNQHKIIIDKDVLVKDFNAINKNSFTYQFSHITRERGCLLADDRIDSVAQGVMYLIEDMNQDEDFGESTYKELELVKIQEQNAKIFSEFDDGYENSMNFSFNY